MNHNHRERSGRRKAKRGVQGRAAAGNVGTQAILTPEDTNQAIPVLSCKALSILRIGKTQTTRVTNQACLPPWPL